MATDKKKKREAEVIEPIAALLLVEKLSKKCLEILRKDDGDTVFQQMYPLLEVIRDTAKTGRFSLSVANKQALERLVQLPGGLLIPTFQPGPLTTQPFDKAKVKDPVPPNSIT